jgi:hypothetical protein
MMDINSGDNGSRTGTPWDIKDRYSGHIVATVRVNPTRLAKLPCFESLLGVYPQSEGLECSHHRTRAVCGDDDIVSEDSDPFPRSNPEKLVVDLEVPPFGENAKSNSQEKQRLNGEGSGVAHGGVLPQVVILGRILADVLFDPNRPRGL